MTTAPRRFKDAPEALPAGLSRALRGAPAGPTPAQARELSLSLGKALGVALPSAHALPLAAAKVPLQTLPVASTASSIAGSTIFAWGLGGMGLGLGLSSVVAFTAGTLGSPTPVRTPVAAASAQALAATPKSRPEPGSLTQNEPLATLAASGRAHTALTAASNAVKTNKLDPDVAPSVAPPSAPSESELSLLRNARSALESAPNRALDLVRAHQAQFGEGLLAQEREVIAIEALLRLGRTAESAQRARSFVTRYPGSAHLRRIERLLVASER